MTSDFVGFSYQILSITFLSLLNSWETGSILMSSAKQGNYWYQFYNFLYDAALDWKLNPGAPALEASTIPLGYRGGGPWLGIKPGTSRTRSQYSTTRLSRRGPWLGIKPGISRTWCQHSTTSLSRRRFLTGDWTRDLPHSMPALYH